MHGYLCLEQRGRASRPDAALCVPAATLRWWSTKCCFCWLKSWAAAGPFWRGFLEKPSASTLGRAAAAACVYPAFPCRGIHTAGPPTDASFPQTVPSLFCPQADAFLAEGGSASVCHPKDGAFYPLSSFMDQRHLQPLKCRKMLQF